MTGLAQASPAVDTLLDRGGLLDRVSGLLGEAGSELVSVEPFYLRHKPGRSALLGLALDWADEGGPQRTWASLYVGEDAEVARAKAATLRLLEPTFGPALAGDPHALLLAFPNDRALRGLSAAAAPRRLGNRLVRAGGALGGGWRVRARRSAVELVRWKPGRRAVLRATLSLADDARGAREHLVAWVRVVAPHSLPVLVSRWRSVAGRPGLETPLVLDADSERGLLITSEAPGEPFLGHARPRSAAWSALARSLSALRAVPPPEHAAIHDDAGLLAAAEATLGALAEVAPECADTVDRLRARLRQAGAALRPAVTTCVHGDLTADQVLVRDEGVTLLDWDELGLGDAHADFASLAADLRSRDANEAAGLVAALAAESLGAEYDASRFAWQRALAESRLSLRGLQSGRRDWRDEASRALAAASEALSEFVPERTNRLAPLAAPSVLARLLDPAKRDELPVCVGGRWSVAAVWPERDHVTLRLVRGARPGEPARWVRLGSAVDLHEFPHDPDLPGMATLMRSGRFQLAGHRLGRRAVLQERGTGRFLFLRPEANAERVYQTLAGAHLRLQRAGVPHAELQERASDVPGWWMTEVKGTAASVARTPAEVWARLGSDLARVHAQVAPGEDSVDGVSKAVVAAKRQIAAGIRPDRAFAAWLSDRIQRLSEAGSGTPAWIHGDLHPGQIVVQGDAPVMLDWERAGVGEAEEDLGNLAAHLAWEDERRGRLPWRAFLRGYEAAGGGPDRARMVTHLRAALLRVLAVHGWRDAGRVRATDTRRWDRFLEECESW